MVVEPGRDWKRADTMTQAIGRCVFALSCGDQQSEFVQQTIDRAGVPIVPVDDALGGVPSAQEPGFGVRVAGAELARDLDEESAVGKLNVILAAGGVKHLETLLERRTVKLLVWIGARDYAHDVVDQRAGGGDGSID